jgi:hypothetical protein
MVLLAFYMTAHDNVKISVTSHIAVWTVNGEQVETACGEGIH